MICSSPRPGPNIPAPSTKDASANTVCWSTTNTVAAPTKSGLITRIFWPPEKDTKLVAEDIPLDIIMEDEHVIVLNKPPGLVVHPAQGNMTGTLVHGLLHHDEEAFENMSDNTQRPGIVHRLDKDTSGVLVVAKNLQARAYLKDAFKEQVTEKTYLAIVIGCPDEPVGLIENKIGRHPVNRLKMAVVEEQGKLATTRYRVLASANGCSLLEVRILPVALIKSCALLPSETPGAR